MLLNLGGLAWYAGFGPGTHLFTKSMPGELLCHQLPNCSYGGVEQPRESYQKLCLQLGGTMGRGWPVDMSHKSVVLDGLKGTSFSLKLVMAVRYACTSGSVLWHSAIAV